MTRGTRTRRWLPITAMALAPRAVLAQEPSEADAQPGSTAVSRPSVPTAAASSNIPFCRSRATPSPCVQPPGAYRHDGFYLRGGGGLGYGTFLGSAPRGDAFTSGLGASSWNAVGGTPAEGFVVAGTFGMTLARGALHGYPGAPVIWAVALQLGALVDWYPDPEDGWHLSGGAGWGPVSVRGDVARAPWSGGALFATVNGGCDWWIGPEWALGIGAFASVTTPTRLRDARGDETGYDLMLFTAGISYGLLFH